MRTAPALAFAALLAITASAAAGEIKLTSSGPREAAVGLPGGAARLALVKAWGRTSGANRTWTLEGDKLPAMTVKAGDGWVEATIVVKPEKDENIRIFQLDLDLSAAAGWDDSDGKRTFLRSGPKWSSAAELLAGQASWPERWSWPVGAGRLAGCDKSAGDPARDDYWTGFGTEQYKGQAGSGATVDVPAVLRQGPDGQVLGLTCDYGLAVGFEGKGRLRICPLARAIKAGRERVLTVRLWLAAGRPDELGAKWAEAMDRWPLRVAFCGDSVGAANGSYANQAVTRLFEEFGGRVRAINTSRGGATTREFVDVWQSRVMDYDPNLVVFQLSYNDAFNGSNRLTPEDVVANYRKMIDSVLARPGGRAVVLSPLSFDKKRLDAALANGEGARYPKGTDLNEVAGRYIAAIEKMVAGYAAGEKTAGRVVFVNVFAAMVKVRAGKGADYALLVDGSHPGSEGHAVLFESLWPELKRQAEATLKEVEGKR